MLMNSLILLKKIWETRLSTVDPSQLPSDISKIKNLDFSKSEDQDIFLDYARNFLKTYKGISETELDYSNA